MNGLKKVETCRLKQKSRKSRIKLNIEDQVTFESLCITPTSISHQQTLTAPGLKLFCWTHYYTLVFKVGNFGVRSRRRSGCSLEQFGVNFRLASLASRKEF